ncbi:hypothetical protein [Halobaculum litoreum]|uniref:Uncharacterized protein n=1 Tax=Halobaculum litoreum TaxID=3031998 RepID=A0ABD5XVL4_9EURY|nr:hypothetical protein [Halobaculum sp. DT92]
MTRRRPSRRDLLAAVAGAVAAATAGCTDSSTVSYPGTGTDATATTDTDGPPAATATDTGGAAESTATPTPAETPTQTATATPTRARAPPRGSLRLLDAGFDGPGASGVRPYARFRNVGDVTFGLVELRFDVYYTPLGGDDDDRRLVASGYGSRAFGDEAGFAPGEERSVGADLRLERGSGVDGSTDRKRLDVAHAYRRVRYR